MLILSIFFSTTICYYSQDDNKWDNSNNNTCDTSSRTFFIYSFLNRWSTCASCTIFCTFKVVFVDIWFEIGCAWIKTFILFIFAKATSRISCTLLSDTIHSCKVFGISCRNYTRRWTCREFVVIRLATCNSIYSYRDQNCYKQFFHLFFYNYFLTKNI